MVLHSFVGGAACADEDKDVGRTPKDSLANKFSGAESFAGPAAS
jgi:hypothetical protein